MREIDVPRMWWNIRTLRHEAHVTQVTVIDDVPVDLLVDAVELERLARVDRVEQGREGIAQAEAAPAPVTDVEHALEFLLECGLVGERGAAPVEGMTRGSLQAPFAYPGIGTARTAHRERPFKSRPGPSGTDWHASARLSPASRTSRRSRRSPLREPASPCPGTCRCTRAFRPRWLP